MIVSFHALNGMSVNHVYLDGTVISLASYSVTHIFICLCFSYVYWPCLPCCQRMPLSFAASIHFAGVVKVCLTQPRRCPFTFHDCPAAHNLIRYNKNANVNYWTLMYCFKAPSKPRHFVVNLSMQIIISRRWLPTPKVCTLFWIRMMMILQFLMTCMICSILYAMAVMLWLYLKLPIIWLFRRLPGMWHECSWVRLWSNH